MTGVISRRLVLGGGLAALAQGAAAATAPVQSLRPQMRSPEFARTIGGGAEGLITRFGLPGRAICAVADLQSGQLLEAVGGTQALPPASVAKALTALYALDTLGAGYRFRTRVLVQGKLQNGILQGDLWLAGGGDPLLDSDGLADLAAQLKAAGLREVRGTFHVYEGALPYVNSIDPGQPAQLGYSPAVSGIALNFNRVHFEWSRVGGSYAVTMQARAARHSPGVDMARMQVKKRQVPVYTYNSRDGRDMWTVASGALGNGGARWLPVRFPGAYAGEAFRSLARSYGITMSAPQITRVQPGQAMELAHLDSMPLREILQGMLKYSNNLTAEMVGLTASRARGLAPHNLQQSGAAMSDWARARFGMQQVTMVDHSGLGDASRMAPQDLLRALVASGQAAQLRPLLKPFWLRDGQGRVNKGHPISVAAKTGTLNFVSGLGGYMTAADGRDLAFAIFSADTARRAAIPKEDRERPPGARTWNRKAKTLQQELIERWGSLYSG